MDIYAITTPSKIDKLAIGLKEVGNVVGLTSGNPDIMSYDALFKDGNDKILAVNPGIIEWKLPTDALSKIMNLKGICTSSAWTRYIDFDYCKNSNIAVTHTIGANSQSVAEYAIWMMFSLARQLPNQIHDSWKINQNDTPHIELYGKTLGVIGLGNIGSRVANLGKGLGMNVIYWNRSVKQNDYRSVTIDELLSQSDVIINCLEICPETQGFLNKDNLVRVKNDSFFVSILGGMGWGVQDDQYLLDMVLNKKLAGFAVENEHKGTWPIEFNGNVFVPSARAHFTNEAESRILDQWIDGIKSVVNNDPRFRVI